MLLKILIFLILQISITQDSYSRMIIYYFLSIPRDLHGIDYELADKILTFSSCLACDLHTEGHLDGDIAVQTRWDADAE
jgi:hypothetical protein